ncbi:MAG: hypothetical protein HY303_02430 [Candidatus Wallbacteria bacterium]|nr:hypothetical protein [Candidatus Wallbacteria bacterium]
MDDAPGSAVRVTVVVEPVATRARRKKLAVNEQPRARLDAFERLVSQPITNEDRQFWKQLVEEQHEARKLGTSAPEDV